jgi:hypothetical protein
LRRGVLQGSTIANYLFVVYMDAFIKELKRRLDLLGVLSDMLYGPDHSIKAFVDDIVIYCPRNDQMTITAVCLTIKKVAEMFKFKLNTGKSRYITNDGTEMDIKFDNVSIPQFAVGEKYLGRYVVQPPEIVAEVFIQYLLQPLMERINKMKKNRMKYYRKSATSRIFYQFIKTASPPDFLEMVSSFETGYLISWGMAPEEVNNYLYARNFHFIYERKARLSKFNSIGIDTPYIQQLVNDETGYTDAPTVDYVTTQQELDDIDYAKMESKTI